MVIGKLVTAICNREADQKRRCLAATAAQVAAWTELREWNQVFKKVNAFKYLGMMILYGVRDLSEVTLKFYIAQRIWGQFYRLLCKEGDDTRTYERF